MRILLDECLDRRLAREFFGYDVKTVPQMGWAGVKNGRLLALAESAEFDVFITVAWARFFFHHRPPAINRALPIDFKPDF